MDRHTDVGSEGGGEEMRLVTDKVAWMGRKKEDTKEVKSRRR